MIEQIILLIGKVKDFARGIDCPFKVGDLVELKDGSGYPMLIVKIEKTRRMKEPILYCRWYDELTKETRYNYFLPGNLMLFNWDVRQRIS
jgi:uncharacterized protein YodC (DUF2158 family)